CRKRQLRPIARHVPVEAVGPAVGTLPTSTFEFPYEVGISARSRVPAPRELSTMNPPPSASTRPATPPRPLPFAPSPPLHPAPAQPSSATSIVIAFCPTVTDTVA